MLRWPGLLAVIKPGEFVLDLLDAGPHLFKRQIASGLNLCAGHNG